jgi:hypothetical protein
VTASSVAHPIEKFAPKNIAEVAGSSVFCSALPGGTDDPWVMYDFVDKLVVLDGYALRPSQRAEHPRPLNWVVEGSKNGEKWTKVDRVMYAWEGKETSIQVRHFGCEGGFRFVRLKLIGENSQGVNQLALSAWELFGEVQWVG